MTIYRKAFAVLISILLAVSFLPASIQAETNDEQADRIHFIRCLAKSKDSFLIESNGRYGLIDMGTVSSSPVMIQYLEKVGVEHLDFVIATHSHSDHIGGAVNLAGAENSRGNSLIDEDTVYIYKEYQYVTPEEEAGKNLQDYYDKAVNAMRNNGAKMFIVNQHTDEMLSYLDAQHNHSDMPETEYISFSFGDYSMRIYNLYTVTTDDENTNSLVILLEKDNKKILLTGDVNVRFQTEQKIIRAITDDVGKTDLYKIGHHGYSFSTSHETIKLADPSCVIITGGMRGNETGLYHYFHEHGIPVYQVGDANTAIVAEIDTEISLKTYDSNGALTAVPQEWNPSGFKTGWHKIAYDENQWDYIYIDSKTQVRKGWAGIDNNIYYFSEDGIMYKGIKTINGIEYRFFQNGKLSDPLSLPSDTGLSCWVTVNGKNYYYDHSKISSGFKDIDSNRYYFNQEGVMQTGWQKIDNNWYWFDESGIMRTGWICHSGKWYYLNLSGVMETGWKIISGKWYYFKQSGKMCTNWELIDEKWFFFGSNGAMRKKWQKINDRWYYFKNNGAMARGWKKISGKWYYFTSSGAMKTGWLKLNGKWYYFSSSGAMVTGIRKIGSKTYTFSSSGVCVNP